MAVISLAGSISNVQAFLALGVQGKVASDASRGLPRVGTGGAEHERKAAERIIDVEATPIRPGDAGDGRRSKAAQDASAGDARSASRAETSRAQVRDRQRTARRDAQALAAYAAQSEFAYARPATNGAAPALTGAPIPLGQFVDIVV